MLCSGVLMVLLEVLRSCKGVFGCGVSREGVGREVSCGDRMDYACRVVGCLGVYTMYVGKG